MPQASASAPALTDGSSATTIRSKFGTDFTKSWSVVPVMNEAADFDAESVLATIHDQRNERRVIWSPSTTLSTMNIEHYPHLPQANYRKMKQK